MEIEIIKDLEDKELSEEWDQFVGSHPMGTIFQSPDYFRIFLNQKEFEPIAIVVQNEDGQVSGVLSGIIQYQFHGPLKLIASRCVVIGGPLAQKNDPELLGILLINFNSYVKRRAIYTQVRNMNDMDFAIRTFADAGYKHEEHLNNHVDLRRDMEELWNDVHKQKRYEVKRAEREGLVFVPIANAADMEESYKLLKKIYTRIKLPLFPYAVFENAFNILSPKGMACFWAAYSESKLVATMYTLCYRGRIYNYFAGSDTLHSYKFPNSMIAWQVMMWGKEKGMTLFDWGGAGKPGIPYGVRDFKSKFGGQMMNFGRFKKIHMPILYNIAKSAFKLYQFAK